MTMNPVQQAQALGQSIWYDNIRRGLLTSGEFRALVDLGVTGVTANPTILEKAIAGSTDYDQALAVLAEAGKDASEIYEALAVEDLQAAADLLRPVYARTGGADGYVSLEVSPALARDTEGTIAEARRLFSALGRPNVLIKVPATPQGIPAIRRLTGGGVNVNITLIFSLDVYRDVIEAYIAGLEDLARSGGDVSQVASVASFFVSRVDAAVDAFLTERIQRGEAPLGALLGKAGIANARLAYQIFKSAFASERFAALRARGARVQRPLWASTGTKNPSYSDVLYVESLLGPDTVNTVPPATLTAFLDHGRAEVALERGVSEAREALAALEKAGISMRHITARLLADGVQAFADSFEKLLANIAEKRDRLPHAHRDASLGALHAAVDAAVDGLAAAEVVGRIWRRDHTVWEPDPTEIADRLGWLTVGDLMEEQVGALQAFAREVRHSGFQDVVVLGMGGSSLGAEVLRQTIASPPGYPRLWVLDSTVPARVLGVGREIDPAHTLFLVSSKSGTTTEPLVLYRHFRRLVEQSVPAAEAGRNFVAITDPGTPLADLAREGRFQRVLLTPPDIGGRYSALSSFGLAPAALAGLPVATILDRAEQMRHACVSCVPCDENPGAWLGAAMGALALRGRDKLTLVTSPALAGFGPWAEQLIAESTGKDGNGILPVAGEPLLAPERYGDDRFFVFLRLEGDANAAADAALDRLAMAGHPVVRLRLQDRFDLGAEFFRWEFATAVAGSILGINPFNQPDVEGAKELTRRLLQDCGTMQPLPQAEAGGSLAELLALARPGDYFAVLAYLRPAAAVEEALGELRERVAERYRIATTLGWGPRYLHSTGQLHKGGPGTGLFLVLTADHPEDLDIPGESYSFGNLADAQALGDLQALHARGRRVARVHLGADPEAGIRELVDGLV